MKYKIRPIYFELQGYLSQAPADKIDITDATIWDLYNQTIKELNEITGKDYSKFNADVKRTVWNGVPRNYIGVLSYKSKLNGLINRLHAEYFSDEQFPSFGNVAGTVISQSQIQEQSTIVQVLLDVQGKIDEKMQKYPLDSKENQFLTEIKKSLSSVKNVLSLLRLIFQVGATIGLTAKEIFEIFR